jgi:hypothetical protein
MYKILKVSDTNSASGQDNGAMIQVELDATRRGGTRKHTDAPEGLWEVKSTSILITEA